MLQKENGLSIGRALSDASPSLATTTVLIFIENTNRIIKLTDVDGLEDIALATSTSQALKTNVVEDIKDAMIRGVEVVTSFVSVKVSAVSGYFDTLFAKKIYTETICVKKSDGTNVCLTGDQVENMVNSSSLPLLQPELGNGTSSGGGQVLGTSTDSGVPSTGTSTESGTEGASSTETTSTTTDTTTSSASTTENNIPEVPPLPLLDPTPPHSSTTTP
jgi:hypothetical protein